MNPISTTYLLDQGQLAAIEVGNAEMAEVSVIFIHGWLDNAASFLSLMPALHALAPKLHLCAVDLPGHGFSSHKAGYSAFHDYIDDLDQLLLNLSPNKPVLVGHSLGALIASCYSAAFPEQVSGLVQIEGFGPLSEPATHSVTRLRQGIRSRHALRNANLVGMPALNMHCVTVLWSISYRLNCCVRWSNVALISMTSSGSGGMILSSRRTLYIA